MFEPTNPARLVTPIGTLNLNGGNEEPTSIRVNIGKSRPSRDIRAAKDSVPQGDGEILHRRFTDGTEITLAVTVWEYAELACAQVAREQAEILARHLNAILNGSGRYYWTPSAYADERFLDEARWLVPLTTAFDAAGRPEFSFGIDSPFPYFIDSTEQQIEIADGTTETITNAGNTEHHPVLIVGPSSGFTIENQTSGLKIVYDSSLPGGSAIGSGNIAELDVFRNTAYLGIGGEPGDDTNLKPGVDPTLTDYFTLLPGDNEIAVIGADVTVKTNNAWVPF